MSAAEYQTGRFHDGECWVTCLYRLGHKRMHVTHIGSAGVTHTSVPVEEQRHVEALPFKGGTYPLDRMIKRYRKVGRMLGITGAAMAELDRAELVACD